MNKASLCSIFFLAVLVAPVLSQDELPSPEAFATECKADIVHLLQQMDVFIQKIEAGPESGSRLKNEFEITSDRIETKLKFCMNTWHVTCANGRFTTNCQTTKAEKQGASVLPSAEPYWHESCISI